MPASVAFSAIIPRDQLSKCSQPQLISSMLCKVMSHLPVLIQTIERPTLQILLVLLSLIVMESFHNRSYSKFSSFCMVCVVQLIFFFAIRNIVCTVNLGIKLDLVKIARSARNAEYNPKRFAAVIMRIREPRTTALIFSSGKMVCTGAKSEEQARQAARKYARIIQKLGFNASFKGFTIQNMVGSCDVRFHIRLEGLNAAQKLFTTYEPELFPGLVYRMQKPKIVLLIFVSGKIVLTGAKVREQIYQAFNNIFPILKNFMKLDTEKQQQQSQHHQLAPTLTN
ncbi:unnamed protein product [Hymenolepis diminuta]|uniref:TATA-box-binding protein n=1 Tax=Hymenolepis diminuta TaxID=6216 RepID=A0A0R3ST09_HYMDI|nr:unnamed protein product [Hymenolepis diminuta]